MNPTIATATLKNQSVGNEFSQSLLGFTDCVPNVLFQQPPFRNTFECVLGVGVS